MPAGGICILDADSAMRLSELGALDPFLDTFFVKTGGEGFRGHFYFRCQFPSSEKIILYDPETEKDLGDIRPDGCKAYCVGPSCIHPSGKTYDIANDAPVREFTYEEFQETVLSKVMTGEDIRRHREEQTAIKTLPKSNESLVDRLGLDVIQFLAPVNPRPRDNQVEGEHPVHGSDTGSNFVVDPIRNVWYCRRHNTGGGPLEALAIAEGIIECADAGRGCLDGRWPQIFDALKKHGYADKLAELEAEKQREKKSEPTTAEVKHSANQKFALTDAGNSDRLVHQHGNILRYCVTFRSWYIWDGHRWKRDDRNEILSIATLTARSILVEASQATEDRHRLIIKWGMDSQSLSNRNNMIKGATPYVAITPDEFDRNPFLINLKNGTLDLSTLQVKEPDKQDFMTKSMDVSYVPEAKCPLWMEHLNLIFDGDQELIEGFQEAAGYCLLGDNPEQQIFFLYGTGKNGKSETMKVLSRIFGEYHVNIAAESLMVKRGDAPRSDIARIVGARLVTASEAYEGARLAESVIKQLTGDDQVTVRRLYENEFSFKPVSKIWMATNHKPRIAGVDDGIWRRIQLWPFTVTIPTDKRVANYGDVLLQEAAGILGWCLEGFRRYREHGSLFVPDAVKVATASYRTESDSVRSFLEDETKEDPENRLSRKELFERYEDWCTEIGDAPVNNRKFAQIMRSVSYITELKRGGNRMWKGLRWKTSDEKDQELRDQMTASAERLGVMPNA